MVWNVQPDPMKTRPSPTQSTQSMQL
ncbi:hypothetical protein Pmani_025573, partial [Petrolisthes manimaculis]